MSTEELSNDSTPPPPREEIIAKGALYYRMTRILMVVMFVGMGSWFAYDGWIGWPEENRKAELEPTKYKRHSGTDILLQNPPKHLELDKIELGKTAMQKAIDAARRTVQNIDDALKLASISSN